MTQDQDEEQDEKENYPEDAKSFLVLIVSVDAG